jgi:protein-disulfide isomerase
MRGGRKRWRGALDAVATVTMILASLAVIWAVFASRKVTQSSATSPPRSAPTRAMPPTPVPLADSPILGRADAPLAIIEFSDYECPFCAQFHSKTFPLIRASHIDSGKALFALRHLPLERHRFALEAAKAAECAFRQGRFWPFHEELFRLPLALDPLSLRSKAAAVGVESAAFESCWTSDIQGRIERDIELAREIGVRSTPSFLIGAVLPDNTVQVLRHEAGAIPGAIFTRLLDETLEALRSAPK